MSGARSPGDTAAPAKNPAPKAGAKAPHPKPGAKFLAPLPAASAKTPPKPSASTQTPSPPPKIPKSLKKSKKAKKSSAVTPKQRAAREAQKELRRLRREQTTSTPAKSEDEPVKRNKKYNKLTRDSKGVITALYAYFIARGKSTRRATAKVNKLLGRKKPELLARSTLDNWHLKYTVGREKRKQESRDKLSQLPVPLTAFYKDVLIDAAKKGYLRSVTGGKLILERQWARHFSGLPEWKLSRYQTYALLYKGGAQYFQKCRTATRTPPHNLSELRRELHDQITYLMWKFQIPLAAVVNLDETSVRVVPGMTRDWSAKNHACVLTFHKSFVTMLMGITADGGVLPCQVVWKGKSGRAEGPRTERVLGTHTPSNWTNYKTLVQYADEALMPLRQRLVQQHKRKFPLIVLWDRAKSHVDQRTLEAFRCKFAGRIILLWVRECMTPFLQPFDVGVAAPFKRYLEARRHERLAQKYEHSKLIAFRSADVRRELVSDLDFVMARLSCATGKEAILKSWDTAVGHLTETFDSSAMLGISQDAVVTLFQYYGLPDLQVTPNRPPRKARREAMQLAPPLEVGETLAQIYHARLAEKGMAERELQQQDSDASESDVSGFDGSFCSSVTASDVSTEWSEVSSIASSSEDEVGEVEPDDDEQEDDND